MRKIKEMLSDPSVFKFEVKKRKKDIFFWLGGIIFVIFIYIFISSKDYSFLLVLSALTQTLAFLIILIKVCNYQNCSGLSINTLICYAILLISRLTSTLVFVEYLPNDESGDWFYQLCEFSSVFLVLTLAYVINFTYPNTSDVSNEKIHWYYLAIPTFVLALIIHTSLNNFLLTDILWTFSMYLEAVAIFPQINLFSNKKSQIETYTSHYVALCGLSKIFSIFFWFDTFNELNSKEDDFFSFFSAYSGYSVIIAQLLQIVIMADYYYLYFKSLLKGEKINTYDI